MTYQTYQATLLGAVGAAPDIITASSQKQDRKSSSGPRLGKAAAILRNVSLKPKKEKLTIEVTSSSLLVANSATVSKEMSSEKVKSRRNS